MSDHDCVICPCGAGRKLICFYPRCRTGEAIARFHEMWALRLEEERRQRRDQFLGKEKKWPTSTN
jgi:hypothetical protein